MVSLDSNFPGKGAENIFAAFQTIENISEIKTRSPAELLASTAVYVDSIDSRRHRPSTASILFLVIGKQASNDAGRV